MRIPSEQIPFDTQCLTTKVSRILAPVQEELFYNLVLKGTNME